MLPKVGSHRKLETSNKNILGRKRQSMVLPIVVLVTQGLKDIPWNAGLGSSLGGERSLDKGILSIILPW